MTTALYLIIKKKTTEHVTIEAVLPTTGTLCYSLYENTLNILIVAFCQSLCVCACVCVCVCVCVCTRDISKSNLSRNMKLEYIVILYENSWDEFDIGHRQIKSYNSTLVHARKFISKPVCSLDADKQNI